MGRYCFTTTEQSQISSSFAVRTPSAADSAPLSLFTVLAGVVATGLLYRFGYAWLVALLLLEGVRQWGVVVEESLVVLPSLGVQLETARFLSLRLPHSRRLNRRLTRHVRFIALSDIADIALDEGIEAVHVRPYLAVVEETRQGKAKKVHVVFASTMPRLEDLQFTWRSARNLLYEMK
ncbi:hypothetical protein JCM21900_002932 [Sporobolomyces salmonicolor]